MPLVKVASLSAMKPGTLVEAHAGGRALVLCSVEGEVYALDGTCPHRGGPLAHGALHQHAIVCPWHAWEFDCRTGEYDYDPAIKLDRAPVRVDGDDVYLELP